MSKYIYGITAVEIMSILVCVILLFYCVFEKRGKEKTRRDRLFVLLLVSCIAALGSDALSWVLDGSIRLLPVLYICTTLATLMSFVLICEFIIYLTAYIRERQEISHIFEYIYMVFTFAAIVFVIVTSANGKLFIFENGVYADGPWYTAYIIINIISMLLSLVVFITYRKSLSQRDIIATLPYIIFPCIAAAINTIDPEFSYAYPSVVLALLFVYISLQSGEIEQGQMRERIMFELSNTDVLTKLGNRRAYENALSRASDIPYIGVVFCDVNGLKAANDTLGHAAGDALLQQFSELLKKHFSVSDIFRISGDEFVVLQQNVNENEFYSDVDALRKAIADQQDIASVGCARGNGANALELVSMAEKAMYADKKAYYERHGIQRRRT